MTLWVTGSGSFFRNAFHEVCTVPFPLILLMLIASKQRLQYLHSELFQYRQCRVM